MVTWKLNYLTKLVEEKNTYKLVFVHTPKCGGTSVGDVLKKLNITNLGHNFAPITDDIVFTIIRNPIDRFESFLNYRLLNEPRTDWPSNLSYVYYDKKYDLNYIVNNLSDNDIMSFHPFRTLSYWSKNVNIFLKINEIPDFLYFFGYKNITIPFKNTSKKERGCLNFKNRERIVKLFKDDFALYNTWTN